MPIKRKLTDDELSRILTAHENKQLCLGGCRWDFDSFEDLDCFSGCIVQYALINPSPMSASTEAKLEFGLDNDDHSLDHWFDNHYREAWDSEHLIKALAKAGWV